MPNWCDNILTITGPNASLESFHIRSHGFAPYDPMIAQEPYFCFNALIPMPPDVLKSNSKEYKYHWSINHWGTKWDLNTSDEYPDYIKANDFIYIGYNTASYPSIQFIKSVSLMFPDLKFSLYYNDSNSVYAGHFLCKNGNTIKNDKYSASTNKLQYDNFVALMYDYDEKWSLE